MLESERSMSLIDSHCHLNYDYAPKTCADLVKEATQAGVEALITIGTELSTFDEISKISDQFPNVYHTVGVHPHDAQTLEDSHFGTAQAKGVIELAAAHPKCVAIGEIGLDYHYEHSPAEVQRRRLDQQLELALKIGKPIVIHSRDAEADLLGSLRAYASKAKGQVGVIHCFSGTETFGRACLDLGFYLSFSGILTFKKSDELRSIARALPLSRMMVETDAPYLAPMPFRGKKCEPSMVVKTAQMLAELKAVDFDVVAEITTKNARDLFSISAQ